MNPERHSVVLKSALRKIAIDGMVITEEATDWGTKYIVVGTIDAPDGNPMTLDTVWIVGEGDVPKFEIWELIPWRKNEQYSQEAVSGACRI